MGADLFFDSKLGNSAVPEERVNLALAGVAWTAIVNVCAYAGGPDAELVNSESYISGAHYQACQCLTAQESNHTEKFRFTCSDGPKAGPMHL
jgi:hypothetical protein